MTSVSISLLNSSGNVYFGASGAIYKGKVMLVAKYLCHGAQAYGPLFSHLPISRSQESTKNKDKGGNGEKGTTLKIPILCAHFSLHYIGFFFLPIFSHYLLLSDFQNLSLVCFKQCKVVLGCIVCF